MILENLRTKSSMFKTHPFPTRVLNKHVDEYLRQINQITSGLNTNSNYKANFQMVKKAVCGNLNGKS